MVTSFADLDELVLSCRDQKAKGYITEAVASYRVGAYRASIVATWIAVCFDIIEKIRELALAGDTQAENIAKEIEDSRVKNDVVKALKFEREILEIARDKFELISPIEFIDLLRVQEDRNRCAHPSLASEEQIFSPTAELARVHIRSAISHLLAHPPVQGKFALDRLLSEINSDYFPQEADKALIALSNGPLKKPRQTLVRNIIIVLLKDLLRPDTDWKRSRRIKAAIYAINSLHPEWCQSTLKEKSSQILSSLKDEELARIEVFFRCVNDVWQYLDGRLQEKCKNFVSNLPRSNIEDIEFYLSFSPLQASAKSRVSSYSADDYESAFFFIVPNEVVNKFVRSYLSAYSFDSANAWSKLIAANSSDLEASHIKEIITKAAKNSQIIGSYELPILLKRLRAAEKIDKEEFDNLLRANGLANFASTVTEEEF